MNQKKIKIEIQQGAETDRRGNIYSEEVQIKCADPLCNGNCYPFVCYQCLVCKDRWWTHCRNGRPPRGVCHLCWKIQRELTDLILIKRVTSGELEENSKEWWDIFAEGINPELYCYHSNEPAPFVVQIITGTCRRRINNIRCDTPEIKDRNWHTYIQRSSKKGRQSPPEEFPCCREDGSPRGSKQPSRRARQRERKQRRKALWNRWDQEVMENELPRDWE